MYETHCKHTFEEIKPDIHCSKQQKYVFSYSKVVQYTQALLKQKSLIRTSGSDIPPVTFTGVMFWEIYSLNRIK